KEDLLAWYHAHLSDFGTPPARKAAEILIKPEATTAQGWAEAKAQATRLLSEVNQALDPEKMFAKLATENSDDPLSRRNKGSIGYVGRGQMPAPFDTALFGIDSINEVTGPVRTDKGWVLIQLLAKRPGQVQPYAD